MYNIAIIEDDDKFAYSLQEMLTKFTQDNKIQFNVVRYRSIEDFLLPRKGNCDIAFFDIELPGMSGMEGAKKFRNLNSDAVIIFITNLAKYAINGYEVGAMDYMIKPITYVNFECKLSKAIESLQNREYKSITIRNHNEIYKFSTNDIYYVEVRDHNVTFHTDTKINGGIVEITGTLDTYEEQLDGQFFSRCSSCYLVNLRAITAINGTTVAVRNGDNLTISRRKKKDFYNDFMQYLGRN